MTRSAAASGPASVTIATRLYRLALGLLPAPARRAMGDDAAELFVRLAHDGYRRRRALGVLGVWSRSTIDVLFHAVRERREPGLPPAARTRSPRFRIDPVGNLASDVRHALRSLRWSPLYTFVVLATLTLGIGANTAIFTLVNAVLIEPLGYSEPDRVVRLWGMREGVPKDSGTIAYLNFIDVRERSEAFAAAAAYDEWRTNLTGSGEPERLDGALVNAEYFDVLGVRPAAGRFFLPQEDVDGDDRVVVLSHGLWTRKFARDPAVVGSTLLLNGNPHTVVGVAPADFEDPRLSGGAWAPPALWRPLGYHGLPLDGQPSRGSSSYTAIARLADGVTLEAAEAEIDALMAALEREYPDDNSGVGMSLVPLRETIVASTRPSLLLLLGAVALVLAIATANVAGLTVARAGDRARETALRLALGAGRGRLLQLFVTESVLLAAGGGLLGLATARSMVRLLLSVGGGEALPRAAAVQLDLRVLAFTAGVSLVTGLVCGLAPLRGAFRADLQSTLRAGGPVAGGRSGRTAGGRTLVIAEVSLAVVLLVGALLLLRSFVALVGVDTGLDPDDLLAFDLSLARASYPEAADQTAFFESLRERLEGIPGVVAAGTVNILPMSDNFDCNGTYAADGPEPGPGQGPCPETRTVMPGYFRTMGIELLRGRDLEPTDRADAEWVTVINETFARELWGEEDPIGRAVLNYRDRPITVVGVVRTVKHQTYDEPPEPAMYIAHAQAILPWQTSRATVVVRTAGDPLELMGPAREAVGELDPELPVASVRTMRAVMAKTVTGPRFRMLLIASFAATALLLAALGVYGVVAYTVSRSLRDVAIRMALGAVAGQIVRHLMRVGLAPVLAGTALGLPAAAVVGRGIESMLFAVEPFDPVAFVAAPVLLLGVAATACLLPARRAARVDPMRLLREE